MNCRRHIQFCVGLCVLLGLLLGGFFFVPGLGFAATDPEGPTVVTVALDGTGDFDSIQTAIDQAGPGDTVHIKPGRYEEDITIHSKERLTLEGAGIDKVFILGEKRVGSFHIGKWPYGATQIEVSGLTIVEHGGLALGIFNGKDLLLRAVRVKGMLFGQQVDGVRIEGCNLGGSETTGVQFADSQAVLYGNVIHDNDHGVSVAGKSEVRLERNVITRNLFEGVVVKDDGRAFLVNNTIVKNGGGVAFLGKSESQVVGNIVSFNRTGFLVGPTSHNTIAFNALKNSDDDYVKPGTPPIPAPELKPKSDLQDIDPQFFDLENGDFRLKANTPLVQVGSFKYLGALAPVSR